MPRRLAIALLVAAVLLPPSSMNAQGRGASAGRGFTISFGPPPVARPTVPATSFLGFPYFFSDYTPVIQSPPPQIVVVPAPAAAPELPMPSKPEPLLIEWQGDRYVRITGAQEDSPSRRRMQPDYSEESDFRVLERSAVAQPVRELSPAVLVFRDGRKEEVSSYAIADGVMYAGANYWSSGQWTRKIVLADLDVPETLRLNQRRGVKFLLPAGPNEVVTRP